MSNDQELSDEDLATLKALFSGPQRRAILDAAPPGLSELAELVADALSSDDPRAALADLGQGAGVTADEGLTAIQDALGLANSAADVAEQLAGRLEGARADISEVQQAQDEATAAAVEALQGVDAEMAAVIERALGQLQATNLGGRLTELVGSTQDAAAAAADLLRGASRLPDSRPALQALSGRVRAIEAEAASLSSMQWLSALLPALHELVTMADQRGHPQLARLKLTYAALADLAGRERGDPPEQTDALFADALAASEQSGAVEVARRAAGRLQAAAIDRRDFRDVAGLSERVAAVAKAAEDPAAEIMARCEAALSYLRLGDTDAATDLASRTIGRARKAGVGEARAVLTLGQVMEERGLDDEAMRLYEQVLPIAQKTGAAIELGRAALGIARCMPDDAMDVQRRLAAVQVALDVGVQQGDVGLIVQGAIGVADMAFAAGDRTEAVRALALGRGHVERLAGPSYITPFNAYLRRCIDAWGAEAVMNELEALRSPE